MQPKKEQEDPSIIRGTNKKCMFVRCAAIKEELNFYAFMLESFYVSVQIFCILLLHASPSQPNSSIHPSNSLSATPSMRNATIKMLRRWWIGIKKGIIQFNLKLGDKLGEEAMKSSCTSWTGEQKKVNKRCISLNHRLHANFKPTDPVSFMP